MPNALEYSVKEKLIATAKKSTIRQRHAACVIDTRGNAISFKPNAMGLHNHAEIRAYEHFNKVYAPQGRRLDYLIVIRTNKSGNLLYSEPCTTCKQYFKNKNILIVYST